MLKLLRNDVINLLKLVGIMYISISLKNISQVLLGSLFNYSEVAKPYGLINLNKQLTLESKIGILTLLAGYDFIIFTLLFYFWFFLVLYLVTSLIGNRLWFQILFAITVYILAILFFDYFHPNILFVLIMIFLGYANWWMFKKWIKFDSKTIR